MTLKDFTGHKLTLISWYEEWFLPSKINPNILQANKSYRTLTKIRGHGGVRQYLHRMFPVESTRATDLAATLKKLIPLRQDVDYLTHYPVPACLPGDFKCLLISFGPLLPQKFVETKRSPCYFELSPCARTRGAATSLHGSTMAVLSWEFVQLEGTHGFGSFEADLATICLRWVCDSWEPCDDSYSGWVGITVSKLVGKWVLPRLESSQMKRSINHQSPPVALPRMRPWPSPRRKSHQGGCGSWKEQEGFTRSWLWWCTFRNTPLRP